MQICIHELMNTAALEHLGVFEALPFHVLPLPYTLNSQNRSIKAAAKRDISICIALLVWEMQ